MLDLATHGYLLYDGDCGVCEAFADWARRRDRLGAYRITSYQTFSEDTLRAHGITYVQCERGVQLITRKGRVFRGAMGINHFLLSRFPWTLFVLVLYLVPILLPFEFLAYRLFAQNRHRVSRWLGLTACKIPSALERRRP